MHKFVDQIISFAGEQEYPKDFALKEFIKFAEIFYLQNQARDFEKYSIEDLYYCALFNFNFAFNKKEGQSKVDICNPTLEKEGFFTRFTIIDIVNDDMPFLVDSVVAYLDRYGVRIRNIIHPVFLVVRDENGNLKEISTKEQHSESIIQIHLEKLVSNSELEVLHEDIQKILQNVSFVVDDWKDMMNLSEKACKQIDSANLLVGEEQIGEIKDFFNWLREGGLIFLGAKEFDIKKHDSQYFLQEVEGTNFGIFKSSDPEYKPEVLNCSIEEVADSVSNPYVVEILKSRYRSKIHRPTSAERIRIQKFSADGQVIGEFRFIGLFTSKAYLQNPSSIPLIRGKISEAIEMSGFVNGSHNYKDLVSVLESYPRDELFQISVEDLLKNSLGIVAICGRSQVRFFARKDKFNRFVSCLIFTPRDRSSSDLRSKIQNYLAEVYQGEVTDFFVQITEANLNRLHVIIKTNKKIPQVDDLTIEKKIVAMTRIWADDLRDAISYKFEGKDSIYFYEKYKDAFSAGYVSRFSPQRAAIDIASIEDSMRQNKTLFKIYKSSEVAAKEDVVELKIYSPTQEIYLSQIMPVLESFGFNVIQQYTYDIAVEIGNKNREIKKVAMQYFQLNISKTGHQFSEKIKLNFEKTISKIWNNEMQIGLLNRLVISSQLNWKQIFMLRGYTKYLYQTGFRYSSSYISDVLVKYSQITKLLVELFETKFDPYLEVLKSEREEMIKEISLEVDNALKDVNDVVDDTVIRKFFGLVNATLRTNYYQYTETGKFKGYVSFKFDSQKVPNLPLPLPYAEIFVYSTRVEGVHLRGGKVARGGLRWSDRQEDFRTEVLGLMKAQMTKNAVIVPVGSKGGFVVKKDVEFLSRDEIQKEGIECYKIFLRGILDLTDNVILGEIQTPENLVTYDDNDPYLVVAADKGTASFSDIANSISAEYNFWLGDAFASGGSVGYDHKKMGITAKGAWISVMRHFRERGIDCQNEDFTCVGIGDLAGDVFGNGMLLSKHTKLVAAFNHMHIFLDPNPDVATSFEERQRMFNLPRSSWTDYNPSIISQGGGIFSRSEKLIKISPEVKAVLDIKEGELTPNDLIVAILKAPVDLLWNGGIGTYVKATDESSLDVGDRANDALRVNGSDLRCKIIGEGGNLGLTQKGRIEYALNGGFVNTDAMDNSAGVDCSDHEVNIKIALTAALKSNKINLEERNKILESMTDEVGDLVLADNRFQTQAISISSSKGFASLGDQSQFISSLEKDGLLNRKIEFLPSKKEIEKRQAEKVGLTRPELCVLMAYSKMDIYQKLLNSDLLDDKYFESELFAYFPSLMQEKFAEEISSHQLKREIIATQITNFVVNKAGITFINQICQNSGFSTDHVIKNFIIAFDSFRLREVWNEIENLDGKIDAKAQFIMFVNANKLLERSIMWLCRNQIEGDLTARVNRFRGIADELLKILPQVLAKASKESFEKKIKQYSSSKVSLALSQRIASIDPIASAFDIAQISAESSFDLKTIAKIYFMIGTRFSLKVLRAKVSEFPCNDQWDKLSVKTILEELYSCQMKIAQKVVQNICDNKHSCEKTSVESWIKSSRFFVNRFDNIVEEMKSNHNYNLATITVALNRLKPLIS